MRSTARKAYLASIQVLNVKIMSIFIITASLAGVLLSVVISELVNPASYEQGQVASYTIRAPRDVLIEDVLNTEDRRLQAAKAVRAVFALDDSVATNMPSQLNAIFSDVQKAVESQPEDAEGLSARQKKAFEIQHVVDLVGEEWDVIVQPENWRLLADSIESMVGPILQKGVIANKVELSRSLDDGSAVLRAHSGGIEKELRSPDELYSHQEALDAIDSAMTADLSGQGKSSISLARKLAQSLVKVNTHFDSAETERRVRAAREAVDPIYYRIRRGEVIVRQGDVISQVQAQRLKQLRDEVGSKDVLRSWVGYFILSLLILTSSYSFLGILWPNQRKALTDVGLICITLLSNLVLLKVFSSIATALGESFHYLDSEAIILFAPLSAGGILLQVTVGASGVLLFMLSFALLTGMFLQNSWLLLVLIIVGNCLGSMAVRHCSRRSSFISAGLRVGVVNVLVVTAFLFLFGEASLFENANKLVMAMCGGFLSGVIGGGVAPIAEYLGGYITDIKLLELASLDRPLLRDLSLQAPGTWNHSMVIGQLGESAADAIGANGLLVRVGAYYHDIGKMKKPSYFVENQTEKNPHDKLTPSMSALIIKSHVKDGLELAREHRLPQAIVDFIPQHHGTSLISYFYTKALKEAEADEVVEENHYQYGGPKPQSKEAGILMLADVVEASSRTLSDPTPAKIQGLVQKSINRVFATGELEECDLTLQDLHKIAKTFTRVLTGIYHRRVQYATSAEKGKDSKSGKKENGKKDSTRLSQSNLVETSTGEHATIELSSASGTTGSQKASKTSEQKEVKKNGGRDSREEAASRAAQESGAQSDDDEKDKEALKRLGI